MPKIIFLAHKELCPEVVVVEVERVNQFLMLPYVVALISNMLVKNLVPVRLVTVLFVKALIHWMRVLNYRIIC